MGVGNIWQRTLVYFGMADPADEYEDYEDYEDEPPPRGSRGGGPQEDLERSYRERPNVRRLGPRRRDEEFDDIFAEEERERRRAPVRAVAPPSRSEVHLVVPKNFNDAQQIADRFKNSVPVIVNLQGSEVDLAKRLIDFASGLTYALDGGMQRIADKVFLLTPENVEVSAEERARLLEKGFFNQY
ncbi:MAG: cell division protein SepF [Thermoleophilia bacterium]|nr:cell division protein SepF [Thermoleophilia bacterium]MDH3724140.1 cell division protein SepF [Thermoleophilia bacterium]